MKRRTAPWLLASAIGLACVCVIAAGLLTPGKTKRIYRLSSAEMADVSRVEVIQIVPAATWVPQPRVTLGGEDGVLVESQERGNAPEAVRLKRSGDTLTIELTASPRRSGSIAWQSETEINLPAHIREVIAREIDVCLRGEGHTVKLTGQRISVSCESHWDRIDVEVCGGRLNLDRLRASELNVVSHKSEVTFSGNDNQVDAISLVADDDTQLRIDAKWLPRIRMSVFDATKQEALEAGACRFKSMDE